MIEIKNETINCRYCQKKLMEEGEEIGSNYNSIITKTININVEINDQTILLCRLCKSVLGKKTNANKYMFYKRKILHVTTITKYYEN